MDCKDIDGDGWFVGCNSGDAPGTWWEYAQCVADFCYIMRDFDDSNPAEFLNCATACDSICNDTDLDGFYMGCDRYTLISDIVYDPRVPEQVPRFRIMTAALPLFFDGFESGDTRFWNN